MDTEKAAKTAGRRFFGATVEFAKEQRQKSQERAEARRAAEAERRRIYAIRDAKAKESYGLVMASIREHNEAHGAYRPIRLQSDPVPVKECTYSTAFWDCEDPNCYYHKTEKQERGIGTPTRKYHPDFQAKAPEDPTISFISSLFASED